MIKLWKYLVQLLFNGKKKTPAHVPVDVPAPPIINKPKLSDEDWSGNDYLFEKPESSRHTVIRTKGEVYNLKKIFYRLNKEHFGGKIKAKVTWGRYGCRNVKRRTHITFGTYSSYELVIRIHPALDSKEVPKLFVEHVIHHEILHEVYPPIMGYGTKWQIHNYDFRIAEAATPTYKEAMIWERKNIGMFFKDPIEKRKKAA